MESVAEGTCRDDSAPYPTEAEPRLDTYTGYSKDFLNSRSAAYEHLSAIR